MPPDAPQGFRLGCTAVAVASVLFSAKAVLIKLCYRFGVEPTVLMALRMLFSLPFFIVMAWGPWAGAKEKVQAIGSSDLLGIAGLGILGYWLASYFDLTGLQFVSAAMERMILYVYPTLVVLFSAWIFRRPVGRAFILPLLLSYAGIAASFGGEAMVAQGSRLQMGTFLILLSAVCYALFLILQGRMVGRIGPRRLTAFSMLFSTFCILVQFAVTHPLESLRQPRPVLLLSLLLAVFCTVIPAYLLGYGVRKVGAGRAAVISSVGPVSTFLLAAWLLGETAGPLQALGLALVLAGGLMLALRKDAAPSVSGGGAGGVMPKGRIA